MADSSNKQKSTWLTARSHPYPIDWKSVARKAWWWIIAVVVFIVVAVTLESLNGFTLFIIRVGSLLLLLASIFLLIYSWRLGSDLWFLIQTQPRWVKLLLGLFLLVLLVLLLIGRQTVLSSLPQVDWGVFVPLSPEGKATLSSQPKQPLPLQENIQQIGQEVKDFLDQDRVSERTQAIEQAILMYTNQEREKRNLAPVQGDDTLTIVARTHSIAMAEQDFFAHENPQGEDATARAIRSGYPVGEALSTGEKTVIITENIGKMTSGTAVGFSYFSHYC